MNNLPAERSLLYLCIDSDISCGEICAVVETSDFTDPDHAELYSIVLELHGAETKVEMSTLLAAGASTSTVGDVLEHGMADARSCKAHLRALTASTRARKLSRVCREALDNLEATSGRIEPLLDSFQSLIDDHHKSSIDDQTVSMAQGAEETMEWLVSGGASKQLKTGYIEVDKLVRFRPGGLHIIAARPSVGKTCLALNLTRKWATAGTPVLFVSLEMAYQDLVTSLIAAEANIPIDALMYGDPDGTQWVKAAMAKDRVSGLPITITYNRNLYGVITLAKQMARQNKDLVVVVDYLQLLEGARVGKNSNREQEISQFSQKLKGMALDEGITVVALSQLNRSAEHRTNKKPVLSDLRESGAIEQDADVVLLMYRADYYSDTARADSQTEIICAKQRGGQTGKVDMMFRKDKGRFENLAYGGGRDV